MYVDISSLKYRDPTTTDHTAHVNHVRAYNQAIQREVTSRLERQLADITSILESCKNFAIFTMGSDGRLEKGPVSPIELAIYSRPPAFPTSGCFVPSKEFLKIALRDIGAIHLVDQNIEERVLNEPSLSYTSVTSSNGTTSQIPSPGRVFDSNPIFGSLGIYEEMLAKVFSEIRSSRSGSGLYDDMRRKARNHLKVVESGLQVYKGTSIRHYNPATGEVFYNERASQHSFKQGPMRAIQFTLVHDLLREIRAGASTELITVLPKNTADKLRTAEVLGWSKVKNGQLAELVDCYEWFLWNYHKSQWSQRHHNQEMIVIDRDEMRERLDATIHILNENKVLLELPKKKSR